MTRYLLAAEADKIQDLLFRSSRLREIVGGSQLLERFCIEVPPLLVKKYGDGELIIHSGGSFRILFDDDGKARGFGADLAQVYHRTTGGTLSVAELVPVNGAFGQASEQAEEALRRVKRQRAGWHSSPHLPYVAFCASCGVGLAVGYRAYHRDENAQYLCGACLAKAAERADQKASDSDSFLGKFYHTAAETGKYDWPGRVKRRGRQEWDPVEDIADYDDRRYVAYLLADGNDMGRLFGRCTTGKQMRRLSKGLERVMREALAAPAKWAMAYPPDDRQGFIPAYPLILGGDDLFALIPASWALDFAGRFCQKYEQKMQALLQELGLTAEECKPTVSATVIICKSKHPYRLAHQAGEVRLKEAKRLSKRLAANEHSRLSVVNFEVVLGGRLVAPEEESQVRATLRPYWVTDNPPEEWGLSLQQLLDLRKHLEKEQVSRKRLAEFRALYDRVPLSLKEDDLAPWETQLTYLLERVGRKEEQAAATRTALSHLGASAKPYWRPVDRWLEGRWHGHGLPDLLEAWDFALSLEHGRQEDEEVQDDPGTDL
jgi:hypothetical protein